MKPHKYGSYLRSKRVAAGLSLREVADKVGISHVHLGEVERGVQWPLKKEYWDRLVKAIPGVTLEELGYLAERSRPLEIPIEKASPQYQDLGLALARRIENQDLPDNDMQRLLEILRGGHRE